MNDKNVKNALDSILERMNELEKIVRDLRDAVERVYVHESLKNKPPPKEKLH